RGRHTYVGIDTLALTSVETADVLRELAPGFASGDLRPFPIGPGAVYPLERAAEAYRAVLGSSRDRLVLRPDR
ncbi:MAG TPA: zinc-binding alcohol dehydrogenase family protein, partial [Microvirga sp.]|nr:zinc-binding alcohol dehydrogenase family protein [Microvirga sp.]